MPDEKGWMKSKQKYATAKEYADLADAMKGADVFLGLSKGGLVNAAMVQSMAVNPIVFALANPDPEIGYDEAMASREDVIMATGRSDHPNQVNNVLGFPYIFRGALDVRATGINDAMKLAAVRAIASLAEENVPDEVSEAYGEGALNFGRDLIIPKPVDPRLDHGGGSCRGPSGHGIGHRASPHYGLGPLQATPGNALGERQHILAEHCHPRRSCAEACGFRGSGALQSPQGRGDGDGRGHCPPHLVGSSKPHRSVD